MFIDDGSEDEKTVLMAPKVQCRLVPNGESPLVVTMGLENFEFHPEGHRSRIVHEFIRQRRDGRR